MKYLKTYENINSIYGLSNSDLYKHIEKDFYWPTTNDVLKQGVKDNLYSPISDHRKNLIIDLLKNIKKHKDNKVLYYLNSNKIYPNSEDRNPYNGFRATIQIFSIIDNYFIVELEMGGKIETWKVDDIIGLKEILDDYYENYCW